MAWENFVWYAQIGDIWKVARELHERAIQVDVYLQAAVGYDSCYPNSRSYDLSSMTLSCSIENECKESCVTFPAHRLMLAAASPFLSKVLSEHYRDHRDSCINISLPDVSAVALRYILAFIYNGDTSIPTSVRQQVIEAAKLLQIISLVKLFQPDLVTSEEANKENSIVILNLEGNQNSSDSTLFTAKKKRRKIQGLAKDESATERIQIKKDEGILLNSEMTAKTDNLKRCHRQIKSKYSSDIYEMHLTKLRKSKEREVHSKPADADKIIEQSAIKFELTEPELSENLYSVSDASMSDIAAKDCVSDITSSVQEISLPNNTVTAPVMNTATTFGPSKSELVQSQKLAMPITSPLSAVEDGITYLFVPPVNYLEDSRRPQCLSEISSSLMVTEEVEKVSFKEASESTDVTQSLSAHLVDLPTTSASAGTRIPLDRHSLKPTPVVTCSQVSGNLQEEDGEPEDDGLFKLEVLLKDCEDFPDSVAVSTGDALSGPTQEPETVSYEEEASGVDINQWISRDIHSYIAPKGGGDEMPSKEHQDLTKPEATVSEMTSGEFLAKEDDKPTSFPEEAKNSTSCEICGKTYSDARNCQAHIRGVHNEARQMCKHCGKMFKRRCDLYQHEKRHGRASLPCKTCGKIFKLRKDLAAHSATHIKKRRFRCNECDKELTSLRNLKNHIASLHVKDRDFPCQTCHKAFSNPSALQVHIRSVHNEDEGPFRCSICRKTFPELTLLNSHRVVHANKRRYVCKICDRSFNQLNKLLGHQRVHDSERPFTCVMCKHCFKTREGLLKHRSTHTGSSNKSHKCCYCSREFQLKDSYEEHMLQCCDKADRLPDIHCEIPPKITKDEPVEIIDTNVKVFSFGDDDSSNIPSSDVLSAHDKEDMGKGKNYCIVSENLSPVVQFVSDIAREGSQELQITGNIEQMHLNYPVLSTQTVGDIYDYVRAKSLGEEIHPDTSQTISVASLLQEEVPPENKSTLITDDNLKVNTLDAKMQTSVVNKYSKVIILNKVTEDADGMLSGNVNQSSGLEMWVSSEESRAHEYGVDSRKRTDILIVTDDNIADTSQALTVLGSPGMVSPQVMQTVMLNPTQD